MRKLWMLGIVIFIVTGTMGENLITNGRFEAAQTAFPEFWTVDAMDVSIKNLVYNRSGGPNGQASVAFVAGKGGNLCQKGLILVSGEKYKLCGYYKSKNFKAEDARVVVYNAGWAADAGRVGFPENADWTAFEETFTSFDSTTKKYNVAIYAKNVQGEIQFADLKLEALTERGVNGSASALAVTRIGRLTPMQPLLNHIPAENPQLTLRCLDKLSEAYTEYDCVCNNPAQTISLNQDGIVTLNLEGLPLGDHQLLVSIIERTGGKKVFDSNYLITIVKTPKIDSSSHKVLNNLVTEILNQPVAKELQFSNPRDGWIFIRVPTKAAVKLDGKELYLPNDRPEALAHLTAGPHTLNIAGVSEGQIVARSIAEIFNYPALTNSQITGNGSYGWDFMKKHVNYALTTQMGGMYNQDKKIVDEIKQLGIIWLTNNVAIRNPSPEAVRQMDASPGLNNSQFAGVTCDEFGFNDITLLNRYSQAIRQVQNANNRLIYTWIVGKPTMWLHSDFMSVAVNTSRGNGKLLYEAYCHPQANEKAAQAFLDDFLVDAIKKFNVFYHQVNPNIGFVLGNFSQTPFMLDYDPSVDFKYYLDMQLNVIANNPEFKNLGLVGYWGSHYADEELYRWSFKLMRHYVIEGNKTMLSAAYGFKYNPDLLKNGDFADGLTSWKKTGEIAADSFSDYGRNSQKRWNAPNNMGDTFAKFTRGAQAGKLSQTATGLVAGKLYCLQFVVADYEDVKNKKVDPRLLGLNVELPGITIIKDKSYVYIDNCPAEKLNAGRINLHRIVFKATAPDQPVIFSDDQATPNQELILNYVKLTPYFE